MITAGWVIVGKWYFNALALAALAFLIAQLLQLDLFQVRLTLWTDNHGPSEPHLMLVDQWFVSVRLDPSVNAAIIQLISWGLAHGCCKESWFGMHVPVIRLQR